MAAARILTLAFALVLSPPVLAAKGKAGDDGAALRPECIALQKRHADRQIDAGVAIERGELEAAVALRRELGGLRQDYQRTCGELPAGMQPDAKQDQAFRRLAREDARADERAAVPALRPGAKPKQCANLLDTLRDTRQRFADCPKGDKACRRKEKTGFEVVQKSYRDECGELPKDLRKLG